MRVKSISINCLDASAIVKLVVAEDGHQSLRGYFAEHSVFLTTSPCFAEAIGALSSKFKRACAELMAFLRDASIEMNDVDISTRDVFDQVERILTAYNRSKRKRLDLSDAFQLVSLQTILPGVDRSSILLITADEYLAEAAQEEGFTAWYLMDKRHTGLAPFPRRERGCLSARREGG